MRRGYFTVPAGEVLDNLARGLAVAQAEKDLRHPTPGRRTAATLFLAGVEPQELTKEPCRGEDPELWFPYPDLETRTQETAAAMLEQAKAICASCSVVSQCRQGAIERGEGYGVWAGEDFNDFRVRQKYDIDSRQRSAS